MQGPDGVPPGPVDVTYPNTTPEQLESLTTRSTYCTQDITYQCNQSPVHVGREWAEIIWCITNFHFSTVRLFDILLRFLARSDVYLYLHEMAVAEY